MAQNKTNQKGNNTKQSTPANVVKGMNSKNKNKNRQSSGNKNNNPNTKNDQMSKSGKENAPKIGDSRQFNLGKWYYGDAVLADEISRFAFNQFVGMTDPKLRSEETSLPNLMVIPLNPCPGVSFIENDTVEPKTGRGINLALQQWWSILTSKSGRSALYTKNDVGALILALGEIISTLEHGRRFFGITFNYTLRNREIPFSLINALGIDAEDFVANLADYRMRFNTTILKLNKIPIPANINYFQKCQDLYQKVEWDAGTDMAQMYALVPATTWTLKEDLVQRGTVLQTTPMYYDCSICNKDNEGDENAKYTLPKPRKFTEFLDTLNSMIDALMMSSTFSNLYSDMLNAASTGSISLWSFDLVDEKYGENGIFEYNPWFLLLIHNMMFTGNVDIPFEGKASYYTAWNPKDGTFWNDAILDVESDMIVYNPHFLTEQITGLDTSWKLDLEPLLVDSILQSPDAEQRIEMNVYKIGARNDQYYELANGRLGVNIVNMDLPDHYAVNAIIFGDRAEVITEVKNIFMEHILTEQQRPIVSQTYVMTKFQWAPIFWAHYYVLANSCEIDTPIGELNYWTLLDNKWYVRVNDAKYFGLFQIQ